MSLDELHAPTTPGATGRPVETLLDALFANSAETIVIVGEDATITYATAGTSMLLGHDAATAVGQSIFEYVHPDDAQASMELFDRRLDFAGSDFGHVARVRHASGDWLPMVVTAVLLPEDAPGSIAITIKAPDASERIERALRQRIAVASFCNDLSASFLEISEPAEIMDRIRDALADVGLLTGAEIVDVLLEHRDHRTIERQVRWATQEFTTGPGGPVTMPIRPGAPEIEALLTCEQLEYDPQRLDDLAVFGPTHQPVPYSLLSAPLSSDRQRGALRLMRCRPGPEWSDADAELVRTVSSIFSRALRTARSEQLLALTYREGPLGFSIRTWDGVLVDCNRQYLELFHLDRHQADRRRLTDLLLPEHREVVAGELALLRTGEIDRLRTNVEVERGDGTRFWARTHTVPLQIPGSSEQLVLTSVEDVTEIHTQRLELEHAVRHDVLTGVANRAAMSEFIDEVAWRHDHLPSLLIIDLDRFKLVNDLLGHAAGDGVLQEVAARISEVVRGDDLVARLGGDEFAIVVPDITEESARHLADRLIASLERPLFPLGQPVEQTMSIGVALGGEAATSSDLLVRADRALYAAKERGRNGYVLFDESLEDEVLTRLALEADLRAALERSELEIHFQPEFAIDDRSVIGVEALLRWRHPTRGNVMASEFITVAERTGLIDELGRYVLREACRSFVSVVTADGPGDLLLRINISAREFARPELADNVRDALAESGLDPSNLCLEMTETTLMDAPEVALATFEQLREIGVKSAIDDFGTGYSSLSYLKRFPVDGVKIDRTFVEDLATDSDSRAIVDSIMRLAAAMDLEVVAEGVETSDQLAILQEMGCRRAQGFVLSGAVPAPQLAELLRGQRPARSD